MRAVDFVCLQDCGKSAGADSRSAVLPLVETAS